MRDIDHQQNDLPLPVEKIAFPINSPGSENLRSQVLTALKQDLAVANEEQSPLSGEILDSCTVTYSH